MSPLEIWELSRTGDSMQKESRFLTTLLGDIGSCSDTIVVESASEIDDGISSVFASVLDVIGSNLTDKSSFSVCDINLSKVRKFVGGESFVKVRPSHKFVRSEELTAISEHESPNIDEVKYTFLSFVLLFELKRNLLDNSETV